MLTRSMRLSAATSGIALVVACGVLLGDWGPGSRIARLPGDPSSTRPRLSPAAEPAREAPGQPSPAAQQALFPAGTGSTAGWWEGADFRLTGVVIAPGLRLAILRRPGTHASLHVRLDDAPEALAGWRLADVQPDRVRFDGPRGSRTLALQALDSHPRPPAVPAGAMEPMAPPDTEPVPETAGQQLARLRRRIAASREDVRHLLTPEEWAAAADGDGAWMEAAYGPGD